MPCYLRFQDGNNFRDLNFLLRSAQNLKNALFSSTYSALTVSDIQFCSCKYSKCIFMLFPILVCKIPQIWANASNSDSLSYFSKKKTP